MTNILSLIKKDGSYGENPFSRIITIRGVISYYSKACWPGSLL